MAKDKASFESRLERLRGVVEALERGEQPLERALALYKEGLALSAELGRQLATARNEVRLAQDGLLKDFPGLGEGVVDAGADEGDEADQEDQA